MKKIFSLSAIVAMLAMLATSVSVSSCSKDDDEDSIKKEQENINNTTWSETSMAVKTNDKVYFKHGDKTGFFTVSSASTEEITLTFNGGQSVTLGDAADKKSYCTVDFTEAGLAVAKADPANILLAKKAGALEIVSPTKVSSTDITSKATVTYFSSTEVK